MRSGYEFYIHQTNENVSKYFIFSNKATKKSVEIVVSFHLKWARVKGGKEVQKLCLIHLCPK